MGGSCRFGAMHQKGSTTVNALIVGKRHRRSPKKRKRMDIPNQQMPGSRKLKEIAPD